MKKKLYDKYKNLPIQVRASLWFLICAFLQKSISVITTPIFTRLLNTNEYGEYSVWNSWLSIITVFVSLNLYYGVYTSGLVRYEEDRKNFVNSIKSLNLFSCFLWIIIYIITKNFWNKILGLSTIHMLSMLVMIWTTSIFNFWSAEQRVNFQYKHLVILTLLMSFFKPCLGIILISLSKDKVTARIMGLCIVEFILVVPIFVETLKNSKEFINLKYWKYALTFNIPLIPHYLSQVILNNSDRIMIGYLIGTYEAGVYNLAYSIALIITLFNTAMLQTIEPWMYKKLKDGKAKNITQIAYSSFIFIAIINILLILFAPEIVSIFAPQSYRASIWLIPPITLSVYFMFQYNFFAVIEFYYKKTQYISLATIIGATINMISNYIFIRLFGYAAAAYTTLGCYILYAIFHYIFMRKICIENLGFEIYNTKLIVFSSIGFILIGFICMIFYSVPAVRYGAICIFIIILILFHKKIVSIMKMILNIRKEAKNG